MFLLPFVFFLSVNSAHLVLTLRSSKGNSRYRRLPRTLLRIPTHGSTLHTFLDPAHLDENASEEAGEERNTPPNLHRSQIVTKSQIREIRSRHLAGVVNSNGNISNDDIVIPFGNNQNLIAVTGETASGKSLLVARVVELLTGAKAASTFLAPGQPEAMVEIELIVAEPVLSAAVTVFSKLGLDPSSMYLTDDSKRTGKLVLSRSLLLQPPTLATTQPRNSIKSRLKSVCQINGQTVTLKVLATVASRLLAVVDAAVATSALSKPAARLAILDIAVPSEHLARVTETRKRYRHCRRQREKFEYELASRMLPKSFKVAVDSESDFELLSHWIDELDGFEARVSAFCQSANCEDDTNYSDALSQIGHKLATTTWRANASSSSSGFVSAMFTLLVDFRDALLSLDDHIIAAHNAVDALGALSMPNSAVTAVERARNFLYDVADGDNNNEHHHVIVERSHELLNDVETALSACTTFLEDDDLGLLSILEKSRARCTLTVDMIDEILFAWKSLARKHGISPALLPSCHMALKSERDGNVETRTLLPKAVAAEEESLLRLQAACAILTEQRRKVATLLADTVTQRLPSLGMGNSLFRVKMNPDDSTLSSPPNLGLYEVDFLLLHSSGRDQRGGKVNEMASSGEKARLLLAIECALPGSIGAVSATSNTAGDENLWGDRRFPPIAVIYDEIDAHVGGRAAVSLANLLVEQSRSSQVVAITHSPSVAAAAEMHVVIQKEVAARSSGGDDVGSNTIPVAVIVVDNRERRKELARMASGDLAVKEAEVFADALIRDGIQRRKPGYRDPF